MVWLRILVAVGLCMLALGSGLCGLFLIGVGTEADQSIGMTMLLVALGALVGVGVLLVTVKRPPSARVHKPRE